MYSVDEQVREESTGQLYQVFHDDTRPKKEEEELSWCSATILGRIALILSIAGSAVLGIVLLAAGRGD